MRWPWTSIRDAVRHVEGNVRWQRDDTLARLRAIEREVADVKGMLTRHGFGNERHEDSRGRGPFDRRRP